MKKIFFFFDSRATYSYSKNIIKHIDKFRNLSDFDIDNYKKGQTYNQ